ncbi:conserved hypothetical protein [Histoplasma capsulatum G186AR]|uniref:MFS maltose permease n=2 Tax=Ajellomyces capsulatus TaxID=5037 RepID=C0NYK1_AJECG|nr:uncharacterized protein HCBG_07683 [Histoplasma capsulatum G186AR]EEH03557.1 conserved hypothetical protein [Histoplasma capsulatum G186AR]KAG5293871.1 hypothetical protein I7I52_05336 [Histoplasma capsulatum]QSS75323.1 hypothetical protein I7I50_04428 [Histoplasma capsulatum G186AR]
MLRPQLLTRRIRNPLGPLRPPIYYTQPTKPRFFTINGPQLIITLPSARHRPQLPFLHSPSTARSTPTTANRLLNAALLRLHIPRLISTERKAYYQRIYRGLKIGLSVYAAIVLLFVIRVGFSQENYERLFPTPPEWTFRSRWKLRTARARAHPELFHKLQTSWASVGTFYVDLLARLEDPEIDGKGLKEQDEGGLLIEGVGKAGYDISGMSEAWKIGYFQALMGAGEAAEKLDGWMEDTEQQIVGPAECVLGPSNVMPQLLPGTKKMLKEEHCVPAYQSPEAFYVKILTTKGFGTHQKLDAALAYADWLDFKGLKETAGNVYSWAMDIATAELPGDVDPNKVVDRKTGILKERGNAHVTENLLRASTALGVHQVRLGDLPTALSIFVSVLRARRSLPQEEHSASITEQISSPPNASKAKNDSVLTLVPKSILSFLTPPAYPLPTRTGNERAMRSIYTACEEAGLMVYIGEIIFAASSHERGLAWTRDAVDLAEATILQLNAEEEEQNLNSNSMFMTTNNASSGSLSMNHSDTHQRCRECVKAGLDNWKQMVRQLVVKAENEELDSMDQVGKLSWLSWWAGGMKRVKQKEMERKRWEAEELIVQDRERALRYILGNPGFADYGMSIVVG